MFNQQFTTRNNQAPISPRFITGVALVGASLMLLSANIANGQLISNKPFSFRGSNGGVGMSTGGKQAILNDKIFDSRPENMVRAPDGELLSVQKGAGDSAFVSYPGTGQFIPQYKGESYKGDGFEMGVGIFNGFFLPIGKNVGFFYPENSSTAISTWTARVISGGIPVFYQGDNDSVETWTGNVFMLPPRQTIDNSKKR